MNYNICIIKPKNYPHSDAFWELAELLTYSLRDLENDVVMCISEIFADRQNILFGAHLLTDFDLPPSTIIFNTEQLSNGSEKWVQRIIDLGKKYIIVDYDDNNIKFLQQNGCKKVHKFQIGFHKKLNRIPRRKNKDIDVLFYGSAKERRRNLLNEISNSGLKVKHLFGVYGAQRDEYISRAKIVLNCHHFEAKIFEIVRVHYLVNNNIPVVSELHPATKIEPFWSSIINGVQFENIAAECKRLSNDESIRKQSSEFAFNKFQEKSQSVFTKELIKEIS
ncbi:MAG: glycosyltransferase family 1 protein [Gammaproteobacteria bacterium]|nr:glycosyltransferase family 1 protein [Gammaproteobacteria bacterium]